MSKSARQKAVGKFGAGPTAPSDFDYVAESISGTDEGFGGVMEELSSEEDLRQVGRRIDEVARERGDHVRDEFIDWVRESDNYSKIQADQIKNVAKEGYGIPFSATDSQGFPVIADDSVQEGKSVTLSATQEDLIDFQAVIEREGFDYVGSDFAGYAGAEGPNPEIFEKDGVRIDIDYEEGEMEVDYGESGSKAVADVVNEVFQIGKSTYDRISEEGQYADPEGRMAM